jgi:type I restriction enzyme S subunit
VLPKFATIITTRGTVGKYALLSQPMAYSQTNYGILPKIENCFFFTYLLINYTVNELLSSAYGSVFDTITTATFRDIKVTLPSESIIRNFEKDISAYFIKKLHCLIQIQTLENLRDTLLPKLMSGEVRVAS